MASDNVKEKLTKARDLIQDKRYDEARAILRTVDHPTALEWLSKIDQIAPIPAAVSRPASQAAGSRAVEETVSRSKLPIFGLILLVIMSVGGGIAVGALLGFTARFVYLIFASIIIAAALGGWVLMLAVRVGKVRSGAAVVLFGVIMGALIYGTYRYVEYMDFREAVRQEIYAEEPSADPQLVEEFIDIDFLKAETGSEGFMGFTALQAEEGMTVTRTSDTSDSGGITLSKELTIGYWVLEILIALGVGTGIALGQTNQPFCESTNKWLKYQKMGQVPKEAIDSFMSAVQQGDFGQAGTYLQSKNPKGLPKLIVESGRCDDQSPDGRIKVTAHRPGRNNTQEMLNTTISAEQFNNLQRSKQ